MLLSQIY